jgi:hypothetical protein
MVKRQVAANIKVLGQRGPAFEMSTAPAPAPDLSDQASVLSEPMQVIARQYIGARQKSGESLLDMCRWISEARQIAKRGEWSIFLSATNTSEDQATALIAVHGQALSSPIFADAVRRNFLSLAAAYELISAPAETRDRFLQTEQPITRKQIRDEKQAAKVRAGADFLSPPTRQPASDRRAYEAAEKSDQALIASGDSRSVQVATWQADQARRAASRDAARAFATQQRAQMRQWSRHYLVPQDAYREALDHIDALLEE